MKKNVLNENITSVVFGLMVAAIVFFLLKMFLNPPVAFIIGFVAGALLSAFMIARSRGEDPKAVAKEVVDQVINPDPNAATHRVTESLISLNGRVRLGMVAQEVLTTSEQAIDLLLEVVPQALKESAHSQATFDLERISTNHLPELLDTYIGLSAEHRDAKKEELLKQLQELIEMVRKAEVSLKEKTLDAFSISLSFLRQKTA
jgi:hypothetical protein